MGIPRFYNEWLRQRPSEYTGVLQRSVPPVVSSLSLDMNGLIHAVAQMVYAYGEKQHPQRAQLIAQTNPIQLEVELFNSIGSKLLQLLTQVNPQDTLVLAVDGVAPNAKINQQRQRRFRAALEQVSGRVFDSNSITPGTEFMMRLDNYLQRWLLSNEYALPTKVIYSSHLVPGEGEHKIMQLMRHGELDTEGQGAHVLYGLDADLIMLSLLSPLNGIHLMREDIRDVVNIDNLKSSLMSELGTPTAVDDFVVMTFLIGNDFLPHMPALEDLGYGLNTLSHVYKVINTDQPRPLTENQQIRWDHLAYYLLTLATAEGQLLEHEANRGVRYPSRMVEAATTITQTMESAATTLRTNTRITKTFDPELFRGAWYYNALGPKGDPALVEATQSLLGAPVYSVTTERIVDMATSYMRGLAWVYAYYQGGMNNINIAWIYNYHYTPLLVDLASVVQQLATITGYEPIEGQVALNPIHQLLAVLPMSSRELLPPEVRHLASKDSPIADLYPEQFTIDRDGKTAEWQGVVLLPFVDTNRIIKAVNTTTVISPERAELFAPRNHVIILKDPEKQKYLEEKVKFQQFISRPPRGRGGRGRGRGSRERTPIRQTLVTNPPLQVQTTAQVVKQRVAPIQPRSSPQQQVWNSKPMLL